MFSRAFRRAGNNTLSTAFNRLLTQALHGLSLKDALSRGLITSRTYPPPSLPHFTTTSSLPTPSPSPSPSPTSHVPSRAPSRVRCSATAVKANDTRHCVIGDTHLVTVVQSFHLCPKERRNKFKTSNKKKELKSFISGV